MLFLVQYTLGGWVTFNFREANDTIIECVEKIEAIVQCKNQDGQLENALKLSRLLFINELGIFKSADRRSWANNRELWMVEEESLYTISPSIINKCGGLKKYQIKTIFLLFYYEILKFFFSNNLYNFF